MSLLILFPAAPGRRHRPYEPGNVPGEAAWRGGCAGSPASAATMACGLWPYPFLFAEQKQSEEDHDDEEGSRGTSSSREIKSSIHLHVAVFVLPPLLPPSTRCHHPPHRRHGNEPSDARQQKEWRLRPHIEEPPSDGRDDDDAERAAR